MSTDQSIIPRPEYPRPQFARPLWVNLNGEWEFAFDDKDEGLHLGWHDGRILPLRIIVPFGYQTELSGINDKRIHEVVWYARSFELPSGYERDLLLNFGAVDYACTVWINGHEVGHNRGGHIPFQFNIAPYLSHDLNRLTVRVEDRQDPAQPRGKQSHAGLPQEIDYYCTTGIWQTVWLEPVPSIRIEELHTITHAKRNILELIVFLHAPSAPWRVEVEVLEDEKRIAFNEDQTAVATGRVVITIPYAKLWSPERPHLYDLKIRLYDGSDKLLDEVTSYVGMRGIELRDGRFVLNGVPTYLKMILDQGYWPDGYLTAPSDEALQTDLGWIKMFGFNGVRKHQKIEDPRWLYWCDRLGLMVWEEMPNARVWSPEAENSLSAEWQAAVRRDINHPCIVAWVPVNESMGFPDLSTEHAGQYAFIERMVRATRRLDSTRPVIDNDGWEHTDIADICAIHDYTTAPQLQERYKETLETGELPAKVWIGEKPLFARGSIYRGQPIILSEVGGFLAIPKDVPAEKRDVLYQFYDSFQNSEELLEKYRDLMRGIATLKFLAGFCYTQLTDIEQEMNGLLTYDRRPKIPAESIAEIHREFFRDSD